MRRPLLSPVLAMLLLGPVSAPAGDAEAERFRLGEEMDKLAMRNAWKGVDRTYAKMIKLEIALEPTDHLLAAQASTSLGDIVAALERLEAAATATATGERQEAAQKSAAEQLESINTRYGRVELYVLGTRLPALVRFELPFGAQERESIVRARAQILEDRTYKGLLPIGDYMIDGEKFTVTPSEIWLVIRVE